MDLTESSDIGADKANSDAFEHGAEATSDVPIIYIDPKELKSHDAGMLAAIKEQMEGQVPGSSDALIKRYKDAVVKLGIKSMDDNEILIHVADGPISQSPSAIANVMHDGQTYCVVSKQNDVWDSKYEIIRHSLPDTIALTDEQIDQNLPGTDRDWIEALAFHEGAHCNRKEKKTKEDITDVAKLQEEGRADRTAMSKLTPEMAQAYADMRHLHSFRDPFLSFTVSATGPLLRTKTEASLLHTEIAPRYKKGMHGSVEGNFDWNRYQGDAKNAASLLKENPEIYFAVLHKANEDGILNLVNQYNKYPSFENTKSVITAQIYLDYMGNFEDAYRRRVLGQLDTPVREPSQLIPIEAENAYFAADPNRRYSMEANEVDAIAEPPPPMLESEKVKPYTTRVDVPPSGKPTLDEDGNLRGNNGGRTMPDVFEGHSNPDPATVSQTDPYVDPAAMPPAAVAAPPSEPIRSNR